MLLEEENIIKSLNEFIKEKDLELSEIEEFMKKSIENEQKLEETLLILLTFFLKENQLGHSVYTQYVEETKCPIDQSGPLPDFAFDPISNKNEALQDKLVAHFSISGENMYEKVQFLIIFFYMNIIVD